MTRSTTKPNIWLKTVPMPVPRMPMPSVKVNMGTSTTLSTAPVIMPYMALAALPWKRIWLLSNIDPVMNGAPSSTMARYFSV